MPIESRFKDASPSNTVEHIKSILRKYNIETEEYWMSSGVKNCHSVRVTVKGAEFGANGKGMNEEFARASGYAEFMERFQGGYLTRRQIRDNVLNFSDEVEMSKEACAESCSSWITMMAKGLSALFHTEIPVEHIQTKCFESEDVGDTVCAIPFYNVTKDCFCYLPKKAIPRIYNTNGLAAGNTLEEAFVQGLSEIFERHNVIRCFFGNITPPTIPDEYLQQFSKPYETIQNLRENGLEVILKDCSMGEPFPLVAAIAIDKEHHAYHVHMGSHPVFEIALERSLTEMFQGRTLAGVTNTTELASSNTKARSNAELVHLLTKGCGQYPLSFFAGTPSYEFSPFPDRSKMSNAQMLKEFVDYIAARGHELYVRDISHLGFTSVCIIVPGMSEAFPHHLLDQFPEGRFYQKYKDAACSLDTMSVEELSEYRLYLSHLVRDFGNAAVDFKALTAKEITGRNSKLSHFLGRMVFTYLEWLFSKPNAIKYAKAAIPLADKKAGNYLSCLCTYHEYLASGMQEELIFEGLAVLFDEDTVSAVRQVVRSGENPFARFIVHCSPELCPQCPYQNGCIVRETNHLIELIRSAAASFDSAAAFERLRNVYQNLT